MDMDDFLVSVDDHLVEPPDMFDGHIPDKYQDDVRHVRTVTQAAGDGRRTAGAGR